MALHQNMKRVGAVRQTLKKSVFNISNYRHSQLIITFRAINEVFWASECRKGHEPMLLAKQLCYCYGEYIPLNVT